MNRYAAIEASVNVELELAGPTTIATVTPPTPEQYRRRGQVAMRPEFTEGLSGVGIARCRPEDHYDQGIGIYLATIRAHQNFLEQVAQRVVASVETETEYQQRIAGERVAAALQEVVDSFNNALEAAGIEGAIIVEER